MNLPNILSLFRLFVTAFFILLVAYERFTLALFLFVLQALSDLLDGFFARRMGAKTNLGAYLDPVADKVMLTSSYIVLCFQQILPLWLVGTVFLRDLVISVGFLILWKRGLTVSPAPSLVSKMTTVFQMLTIVYVLAFADRSFDLFFFYATALLTAVSGIQYLFVGWTAFFRKEVV
jgi:cardiolipin synthase